MLDVAGRRVQGLALAPAGPERHGARLPARGGVPPGIYRLRLTLSGSDVRRRVVLLP